MKQHKYFLSLFLCLIQFLFTKAQTPSIEEAISLVITQKKASDDKDAYPFTIATGTKPKLFPGHYTSKYNKECIVLCSLLQGREYIQVVLLLYQNKEGYWVNGCWYYDNVYRVKVKDFNRDDILELILETKINAGSKSYGNYKVISLLNQNTQVWYENNTVLGFDKNALKTTPQGKEITKDVKVSLVDSIPSQPIVIKERTTIGKFNNYTDSAGVKLIYETTYNEYKFAEFKYIPKVK